MQHKFCEVDFDGEHLAVGKPRLVSDFMLEHILKARDFLRRFYSEDRFSTKDTLYEQRVRYAKQCIQRFDFDDGEVEAYIAGLMARFVTNEFEQSNRELINLYIVDMFNDFPERGEEFLDPHSRFASRTMEFLSFQVSADYLTFYYGFFGMPRLREIMKRALANGLTFNPGKKPMTADDFVQNAKDFYEDAASIGRGLPVSPRDPTLLERVADELPKCVEVLRAVRCEFLYH